MYYFHQFSFISVFANFFIVPFSEIIIIFSFLMTAFIAFNFNSEWINTVYDLVIQLLLRIIHWFADFDSVFVENIPMNEIEVFFLFVIIYFLRFTVTKFNIKTSTRLIMSFLYS
uniref:ComEC/Rec2 family competence protein n=1 Tax=Chryseobacterium endophyticum TaxID=1854762 RepID=A0AAU6WPK6_9FLAO